MLGGFRAEVGGVAVADETWRRSRARRLVALLALSPAHRLHREQVMDALWPDLEPHAAAANLRKAVHFARQAIGAEQIRVSQSLVRLGDPDLWVDIDAFRQAVARGDADGALALYGGELLPEDRFEPWAEGHHEELRAMLARVLLDRAEELGGAGDRTGAITLLERLVAIDPLHETAYGELVRLTALDGDRHVALRWYQQLEDTLRDELGLVPNAVVRELHDDVVAGRLAAPPSPGEHGAPGTEPPLEDRRLVTVVVAEVATPVRSDPEVHARRVEDGVATIREEIELSGGVVEGRVGTRVVAVFGAPALGDDHGRAHRAAAHVREALPGTRIGLATGWAVVRDAAPGDRIAGRVVDEAMAALGDDGAEHEVSSEEKALPGQLVGRERELQVLDTLWTQVQAEGTLQFALVAGQAGIGKSRLVEAFLDRHPDAVVRRSCCLPGGMGMVIGPMADIVRAELADDPDVLERIEPSPPAQAWMRRLLAPLLGEAPPDGIRVVEPSEVAASWARFSTGVATLAPRIFFIEDVHWADPALLAHLGFAFTQDPGAPLLIVGTARPELFDHADSWLGGRDRLTVIPLAPLHPEEIDRLVDAEVGIFDRSAVVHRAAGNPLFALELARLVREDATMHRDLPSTIRSVVTARFDALGRHERALVQAASLAGAVTSVAELSAMTGLPASVVEPSLVALAQRDLITLDADRVRFGHDLIRTAAADQVTRRRALELHRGLAEWMRAGAPLEASARVRVAWHYHQAADAARRLGDPDAAELTALAVRCLVRAADALGGVDLDAALDRLESAAGAGAAVGADIELRRGRLLFALGRWPQAQAALSRSVAAAHDAHDDAAEVDAMTMLAEVSWHSGEIAACRDALERCAAPLSRLPAGSGAAAILGTQAALRALTGDAEGGVELAEQAVPLARSGHDAWSLVRAVEARGTTRVLAGDVGGYDDFIEALEIATANGLSFEVCGLYGDFAALHWQGESPEASLAFSATGLEIADQRGLQASGDWLREVRGRVCFDAGRWDEALALGAAVLAAPASRHGQAATASANWSARIHLWRGDPDEAARLSAWALPRARRHVVIQALGPALVTAALIQMAQGTPDGANELMTEYLALTDGAEAYRLMDAPDVARLLVTLGRRDDAAAAFAGIAAPWARGRVALETARAWVTDVTGDAARDTFTAVARHWHGYGSPFEEMLARARADGPDAARDLAQQLGVPWGDPGLPYAALARS
jgi:DNA-binding SARP family transcriptional activator